MGVADLSKKQIYKKAFESDFNFFARKFISVVEPETEFTWNWHLDELCAVLEKQYRGELPRNIDVNMPPRLLKSLIINVLYPCWVWTQDASKKIGSASSNANLALKFNVKRRDLILSREFQHYWPIRLKEDQSTKTWFQNTKNGEMRSYSANGKVTGDGFDIQITDDLIDVKDSFRKKVRTEIKNWYSNAFHGRTQNKKKIIRINVNQRLHVDDISNHLVNTHGFSRMVLEMVKTNSKLSTIPFNDPREIGEFMFPERYGPEEMAEDKKMGTYYWSSQFQQSPMPIGGGIIKKEWMRHWTVLPDFVKTIITADLNMKEGGDFACFMYWGLTADGLKYLIDIVRGRWSYKKTKEEFKAFCKKHPAASYKFIEDKANGPALISDLEGDIKLLKAWPEKKEYKSLDKVARLRLCEADFEGGNVIFPSIENMPIVEDIVTEITSFTENGSTTGNDDATDTATMGILELKTKAAFFEA